MIKLVIAFLAAFVTAMAGATGFAVWRARKFAAEHPAPVTVAKASHADRGRTAADSSVKVDSGAAHDSSAAHDSTTAAATVGPADSARGTARGEHAKAEPPGAEPVKADAPNGDHGAVAPSVAKGVAAAPAPAGKGTATGKPGVTVSTLPSGLVGERLGKIFASMPAKEAAKVLGKMEDADITTILGRLNDRKASEILSQLPTERAAAISRAVLARGAPGGHQ